jgi:hypothetical protein
MYDVLKNHENELTIVAYSRHNSNVATNGDTASSCTFKFIELACFA